MKRAARFSNTIPSEAAKKANTQLMKCFSFAAAKHLLFNNFLVALTGKPALV